MSEVKYKLYKTVDNRVMQIDNTSSITKQYDLKELAELLNEWFPPNIKYFVAPDCEEIEPAWHFTQGRDIYVDMAIAQIADERERGTRF